MANYKTNMWTGTNGLDLTGVFPEATANGSVVSFGTNSFFNASTNNNSELHGCTNVEARDDVRKFLWGILEQTYVAFTGGRNQGTPDKPAGTTA